MDVDQAANLAGYREHEHTADREIEVWAPDFAGLLEQAARGMYALAGVRLQAGPRSQRTFTIEAGDREEALVAFLEELLFLLEMDGLGFDQFAIKVSERNIDVSLAGAPVAEIAQEIKAVTYHNLKIRTTATGLAVNLVFDV